MPSTVRKKSFGKMAAFLLLALLVLQERRILASTDHSTDHIDTQWNEISKSLIQEADSGRPVLPKLNQLLPGFANSISQNADKTILKSLWGESVNTDGIAKSVIVHPQILETLLQLVRVPPAREQIVHAGVEHTYGYLFSTLETRFGHKRARWIQGEIEHGFQLPDGLFSPNPPNGTLFANASYFFGSIALRTEQEQLKKLEHASAGVASAIVRFPYQKLRISRIEEIVQVPQADSFQSSPQNMKYRAIRLRTDLVAFPNPGSETGDTFLLVYSVQEGPIHTGSSTSQSENSQSRVYLITGFPVRTAFTKQLMAPENFTTKSSDQVEITTHYNAYVEGLTGKSIPGQRYLIKD